MIKVLMVDDEKMVRKGIISIMNWERHNMIVVGEASNGRSALEFLKDNHVDLIITDLTMPGLCGLEFIKRLRKEYPSLYIVISTIHQEFDIIQKALQYDILDYITKSQIETNNTDKILERVSKRIKQKKIQSKNILICEKENFNDYIIVYFSNGVDSSQIDELSYKLQTPIRQLNMKLLLIQDDCKKNLTTYLSKEKIAFQIISDNQIDINTLLKSIDTYINNELFYEYSDKNKIYKLNIDDIKNTKSDLSNIQVKKIGQQMKDLTWIYSEVTFDKNIKNILDLSLNKQEMKKLINLLLVQWSVYINYDMATYYERLSYLNYWYEYKLLLNDIRNNIRRCIHIEDAKESTIELIEEAISYIHVNYNNDICLKDILNIVHMSKSYFSKVFKQVTNKTYTNYLKELRIEKAKKMLVESNGNIYYIGQKVGYKNEKYFRKTFKEVTGLQPKKYRELNK
ncbi:response regulator transcription factor [Vallitalea sp.]|jgi:two-component system response regulator YesN|uniref:response regulator transcription factor n=1 Tax=Vallitalea sp. TaxID=1882829 RepID=UPI0025CE5B6A|nr:response regulator [Vallitalea sp.]MCT4687843.1 response regulator [Vallitalea sp.]